MGILNPEMGLCPACSKTKPFKEFTKWLTKAQAASRGFTGERRVLVESKLCKDCQPKPKSLKQCTERELKNKMAHGDVHEYIGKAILAKRKKDKIIRLSQLSHERWNKERAKVWDAMLAAIGTEIRAQQVRLQYIKRKMPEGSERDALTAFVVAYKDLLIVERAEVQTAKRKSEKAEPNETWKTYMRDKHRFQLIDLWNAVPLSVRARVKLPELFNVAVGHGVPPIKKE